MFTNRAKQQSYVGPVSYDDLVDANRNAVIDPNSQRIIADERKYIDAWRRTAGRDAHAPLTALALSGGGIRSATFALGVTQALASHDLMHRFDYLSTVSGGGYAGSSLTWLTGDAYRQRVNFKFGVDREHFPYPVDAPDAQRDRLAKPEQDAQLIYLRHHGKYLTPGKGLTLASAVAVVLRGFFLNLLVWMPLLVLLLVLLARPIDAVFPPFDFVSANRNGYGWAAAVAAAAALLFAVVCVIYSLFTRLGTLPLALRYKGRRAFEKTMPWVLGICVFALAIALLPRLHDYAEDWLAEAGAASVLAGLASAVATFMRSRDSASKSLIPLPVIASIGAILTLYGMLLLAYSGAAVVHDCLTDPFSWTQRSACEHPNAPAVAGALLALSLVTGFFVNVNLVSLHRYYRDRLMEAFLPDPPDAKSQKHTERATLADAAWLKDFGNKVRARSPTGPLHLLNTNVILVNSSHWNWRVRGGDSFILSPLYCGSNATGWQTTENFLGGEMTLSTAMAISGAAANPYSGGGIFRNRAVAMLMALSSVRLGYWVSNPHPDRSTPFVTSGRTHFSTMWREVFGKLDEEGSLVQLSDGGHFDNLGVYELVRRRVKLIVACDGTADPEFAFGDFITLLSRIEADFGARIVFDQSSGLEVFMPKNKAGYPRNTELAQRGYTVGTIHYSNGDEGTIVYVTTTLFTGLPLSTLGYKAANADFPDQSTADQFFDEAQFEAYRHLGYSVGSEMVAHCRPVLRKYMGAF